MNTLRQLNKLHHWPIGRFWCVCFVFGFYRLCPLKWRQGKSRRPWNFNRHFPQEKDLMDTGDVQAKILGFVNRSPQFNAGFILLRNRPAFGENYTSTACYRIWIFEMLALEMFTFSWIIDFLPMHVGLQISRICLNIDFRKCQKKCYFWRQSDLGTS